MRSLSVIIFSSTLYFKILANIVKLLKFTRIVKEKLSCCLRIIILST